MAPETDEILYELSVVDSTGLAEPDIVPGVAGIPGVVTARSEVDALVPRLFIASTLMVPLSMPTVSSMLCVVLPDVMVQSLGLVQE